MKRGSVDLRKCKKGDILISALGAKLKYLRRTTGGEYLDHLVEYFDENLGDGTRTNDGYVFKNNRKPKTDHDIVYLVDDNMSYDELCVEVDRLDDICDDLISKFDKTWFTVENLNEKNKLEPIVAYDEYCEKREASCQPYLTILTELSRKKRFIMPYELDELPTYGDVMSLDDFISCVECGGFINYDGYGAYVIDGKRTNIDVFPSDVKNGIIRNEFDTIIWFNR